MSDDSRRTFLQGGAAASAGVLMGAEKSVFRTLLCDPLNIDYPIVQAGMADVAGPELVAAVSEAGGMGIMAGTLVPPELRTRS